MKSHGWIFLRYYAITMITQSCRFHEILHQNHNISFLQICVRYYTRTTITHRCRFHDRDITPKPQYLMVAYFMRYNNINTISHGCRIYEILHQIHNISWLQNLWYITPDQYYIILCLQIFQLDTFNRLRNTLIYPIFTTLQLRSIDLNRNCLEILPCWLVISALYHFIIDIFAQFTLAKPVL